MIFDHLPESGDWQLLAASITSDIFRNLPNLKPAFFQNDLRLGSGFSSSLAATAGTPTGLTVAAPESVAVVATLSLPDGREISAGNLFLGENGIRRDIVVGPLPVGSYILRLYVRSAAAGPYTCAADYLVNVASP